MLLPIFPGWGIWITGDVVHVLRNVAAALSKVVGAWLPVT
jgi:hypothetical protein